MEANGLHERMKIAAGERTYRQIGKLTSTHAESVRRYMQGQAPSVEFLSALCAALEINGSWLLTGQGPMNDHEIQPFALRAAGTPDLLRALSDTVSVLIRRVDRLERLVQTTEIKLRAAEGSANDKARDTISGGESAASAGDATGTEIAADRIGAAAAKRASPAADRADGTDGR